MPDDGFWAGVLTRITTVRQGTGVVGQLSAVMVAALAVVGLAAYFIVPDLRVTIPLLFLVGAVMWWVRDFIIRGLDYADKHPEYASIAGQQTVQIIKAQASRERQTELPPSANVAPPIIEGTAMPSPAVEDKNKEEREGKNGDKPR